MILESFSTFVSSLRLELLIMDLTFLRNALKLSTDGVLLNFSLFCTLKCQPRKSNPSVARESFVFFSLISIPLSARKSLIFLSNSSALSCGLRKYTMSSAYRTQIDVVPFCLNSPMRSIPFNAMLAKSGLNGVGTKRTCQPYD